MKKKGSNPMVEQAAEQVEQAAKPPVGGGIIENVADIKAVIPQLVTIADDLKQAMADFVKGLTIAERIMGKVKVNA